MRIALFYHSLVSDWNHGNAHFLRGMALELQSRGYELRIFEPENCWSRENLLLDAGPEAIRKFHDAFPSLRSSTYRPDDLNLDEMLDGVDLVLVHEWNDERVIAAIGEYRRNRRELRVFFHDTHHRAFTERDALARFELESYDTVLAYGASLKDMYERQGWGKQVFVWHEAADVRTFYPRTRDDLVPRGDLVWIGNWGDDERTKELREFFFEPVKNLGARAQVYGVRYPEAALRELREASIAYGGWLPNFEVPRVFAEFKATVHVPRRPYTQELRGIPTIRPFEALACGIPLVSAPWEDSEGLFRVGRDFLMARNGKEMQQQLREVLMDRSLAENLAASGLETIAARHTCAHRADELLTIYESMRPLERRQAEALAGVSE